MSVYLSLVETTNDTKLHHLFDSIYEFLLSIYSIFPLLYFFMFQEIDRLEVFTEKRRKMDENRRNEAYCTRGNHYGVHHGGGHE